MVLYTHHPRARVTDAVDSDRRELDLYDPRGGAPDSRESDGPWRHRVVERARPVRGCCHAGADRGPASERPRRDAPETWQGHRARREETPNAPEWFRVALGAFSAATSRALPADRRDRRRRMGVVIEAPRPPPQSHRGDQGIARSRRHQRRAPGPAGGRSPHHRTAFAPEYPARLRPLARAREENPWCSMMRVPGDAPTSSPEKCASLPLRLHRGPAALQVAEYSSNLSRGRPRAPAGHHHRDLEARERLHRPRRRGTGGRLGRRARPAGRLRGERSPRRHAGVRCSEQLGSVGRPWADARSSVYSLGSSCSNWSWAGASRTFRPSTAIASCAGCLTRRRRSSLSACRGSRLRWFAGRPHPNRQPAIPTWVAHRRRGHVSDGRLARGARHRRREVVQVVPPPPGDRRDGGTAGAGDAGRAGHHLAAALPSETGGATPGRSTTPTTTSRRSMPECSLPRRNTRRTGPPTTLPWRWKNARRARPCRRPPPIPSPAGPAGGAAALDAALRRPLLAVALAPDARTAASNGMDGSCV